MAGELTVAGCALLNEDVGLGHITGLRQALVARTTGKPHFLLLGSQAPEKGSYPTETVRGEVAAWNTAITAATGNSGLALHRLPASGTKRRPLHCQDVTAPMSICDWAMTIPPHRAVVGQESYSHRQHGDKGGSHRWET